MSRNRKIGLLMAFCALLFASTLRAGFVDLDDRAHLWQNPFLSPLSLANLKALWTQSYIGLYVPLTYTVWAGLRALAPAMVPDPASAIPELNAWPFHAFSLALHLGSTWLVWRLARRLAGAELGALAGAALFAWHPLQVEPVAWVSSLKDTLSVFALLLSFELYLRAPRLAASAAYFGSLLVYLAALLAKPSSVVAGPLIFIINYFYLNRRKRDALYESLPWLALALPMAFVTARVQADELLTGLDVPWAARPLVALDALGFYLRKLVWPIELGWDYGRTPEALISDPGAWMALTLPLAAAFGVWRFRHRHPRVTGAALFSLIALVPVLGLKPFSFQELSTVADRYMYLPMVGVALLGARIYERLPARGQAGLALYLAWLAGLTALQARHWQSSTEILEHTLRVNPHSWIAENNLGSHYEQRGNYAPAIEHYLKCDSIRPRWESVFRAGTMLVYANRYDEAASVFLRAARLNPSDARNFLNLGYVYQQLKQPERARTFLQEALRIQPGMPQARDLLTELQ